MWAPLFERSANSPARRRSASAVCLTRNALTLRIQSPVRIAPLFRQWLTSVAASNPNDCGAVKLKRIEPKMMRMLRALLGCTPPEGARVNNRRHIEMSCETEM